MAIIYGNNTVFSSLEISCVKKLYVAKDYSNNKILDLAKKAKVKIIYTTKGELDKLSNNGNHQGVVAEVKSHEVLSLDNFLPRLKKFTNPIIVIMDELNDPHNLGAILRTCDAFSIAGVIFKSKGQVTLTDTVAKVSTGAINYVDCVQVTNLTRTIEVLKKEGFWIAGLDGSAKDDLYSLPKKCPLCIVVGSEGFGISRLVRENCDLLVKIPMTGNVNCLNASVACSIALYHVTNVNAKL